MMLLRIFMYLLRPSNERLRLRSNGAFRRMCIGLYQSLLRYLLKSYRHYAVFDSILIGAENIKVVHEFRDLEFEKELERNNIDVHSHLLLHDGAFVISKGRRSSFFRYFKWKNVKSVYVGGKELIIEHDDSLSVKGNILGKVKSSSSEDVLIRSIIELKAINKQQIQTKRENLENVVKETKAKQPSNGLFKRERIHRREKFQNSDDSLLQSVEGQQIAKRGFEIDTTF